MVIVLGQAAGMISGLIGIGGGMIIVPGIIFFVGFSQKMAQGTSLAILLLPIGLLGVMQFYKAGYVDIKVTLVIALAFFIGSYFGSRIALTVSQDVLKKMFAILLLAVAVKMLLPQKKSSLQKENPSPTSQTDSL